MFNIDKIDAIFRGTPPNAHKSCWLCCILNIFFVFLIQYQRCINRIGSAGEPFNSSNFSVLIAFCNLNIYFFLLLFAPGKFHYDSYTEVQLSRASYINIAR